MKGMRDGFRNDCRACNLAVKAARYAANPEPAQQRARQWLLDNPERAASRRRQYRSSGKKSATDRRRQWRRKFGRPEDKYNESLQARDGQCAIWGAPPIEGIALHVDHDHRDGTVRALLCVRCNNGIALFREDASFL